MSNDSLVNVGAAGAIVSPWWLPELHNVSVFAAEIAPILGGIWIVTQVAIKIIDTYRSWSKQ